MGVGTYVDFIFGAENWNTFQSCCLDFNIGKALRYHIDDWAHYESGFIHGCKSSICCNCELEFFVVKVKLQSEIRKSKTNLFENVSCSNIWKIKERIVENFIHFRFISNLNKIEWKIVSKILYNLKLECTL